LSYIKYCTKHYLGLCKYGHISRLITLSVSTLSSFHCETKIRINSFSFSVHSDYPRFVHILYHVSLDGLASPALAGTSMTRWEKIQIKFLKNNYAIFTDQYALNVTTDDVINQLIWSNRSQLTWTRIKLLFHT
jgi:hypothetical protein